MDVAQWLRQLGLERYELTFRENDISGSLLPSLTAEDLKELGILSVGHRRLLLKAISGLRETDFDNSVSTVSGDAERRQLTVMFCDLIGSTALSERLDPEDLRDVIRTYQARVREAISRFGGFIARYVGDGVLVYFGWPTAHETDAERAVRAALAVTSAISDVPVHGETLRARIGIATGLVIVGEPIGSGDSRQQTAIGETPNLAARLQGLAGPGGIVISGHTRRLLGNLFEYRDLGRIEIRGLMEPVSAFEVLRPSAIESRFEALHASQLSPIVGRDDELSELQKCWDQARAGHGQVVLLSGEAGIGKSRLIAALRERLRNEPHIQLRHFCSPHHRDSALHPFIGQIGRAARFTTKDSDGDRLTKLESLVHEFTPQLADVVPILAALLSIPTGERYPPLRLSPAQQRRRTFAALLDQLDGLSRGQPVLLLFEDAHWADPTSLELLDLVTERIRHRPVLVVITFRTEFEPPWGGLPDVTWLVLRRLDPIHVRALVRYLIEGRALPAEVMAHIIAKTDGVPLFIEELTKAVMESDLLVDGAEGYRLDGPIPPLAIPTTLHDSLIARLDRLAPVKEIAQVGAAIGRDFSYALLRGVVSRDAVAFDTALAQLEAAELVTRRGEPPEAIYIFKHALVRDAAYASMLKSRRQVLHRRIADALREGFPVVAETEPETIAHHLTEAGLQEQAIEWWVKASERSRSRSAFVETIGHLGRAIELAGHLKDGPAERSLRLRLQVAYANAQLHARGPAAPEPTMAFARAREIAAQLDNAPERFAAYYGLFISHYLRGEIASARDVANTVLADVNQAPGCAETAIANRLIGMACHAEGDYLSGRAYLERALASYDPERDRGVVWFGVDTAVATRSMLALALWPMGEISYADQMARDAVSHAAQTGHVPTIAFANSVIGLTAALRRDAGSALLHAEHALNLAREHGMPLYEAMGTFARGWSRWSCGQTEAGLVEMRDGGVLLRGQGCNIITLLAVALLAEAEALAGRIEEALALIDGVLADVVRTGVHAWDAEIYRLQGGILQCRPTIDLAGAEAALDSALEIARQQRTTSFRLRAALARGKLYLTTGDMSKAKELLESTIEGLGGTTELIEETDARQLLAQMASGTR